MDSGVVPGLVPPLVALPLSSRMGVTSVEVPSSPTGLCVRSWVGEAVGLFVCASFWVLPVGVSLCVH